MTDQIFTLPGQGGAVVIFDAAFQPREPEEFAGYLNIALDPEGETDQGTLDVPFRTVWREATRYLRQDPRFTMALLAPPMGIGPYRIHLIEGNTVPAEPNPRSETVADNLYVDTGEIIVTDADEFFGYEEPRYKLKIPAGWHRISLTYTPVPESLVARVGIYSDDEQPEVSLRIAGTLQVPNNLAKKPYPCFRDFLIEQQILRPGRLCYARVRRIEGDVASLATMISRVTQSSYGRVRVPDGEQLKADDWILVELIEFTGNFWRCAYIRKEEP